MPIAVCRGDRPRQPASARRPAGTSIARADGPTGQAGALRRRLDTAIEAVLRSPARKDDFVDVQHPPLQRRFIDEAERGDPFAAHHFESIARDTAAPFAQRIMAHWNLVVLAGRSGSGLDARIDAACEAVAAQTGSVDDQSSRQVIANILGRALEVRWPALDAAGQQRLAAATVREIERSDVFLSIAYASVRPTVQRQLLAHPGLEPGLDRFIAALRDAQRRERDYDPPSEAARRALSIVGGNATFGLWDIFWAGAPTGPPTTEPVGPSAREALVLSALQLYEEAGETGRNLIAESLFELVARSGPGIGLHALPMNRTAEIEELLCGIAATRLAVHHVLRTSGHGLPFHPLLATIEAAAGVADLRKNSHVLGTDLVVNYTPDDRRWLLRFADDAEAALRRLRRPEVFARMREGRSHLQARDLRKALDPAERLMDHEDDLS